MSNEKEKLANLVKLVIDIDKTQVKYGRRKEYEECLRLAIVAARGYEA